MRILVFLFILALSEAAHAIVTYSSVQRGEKVFNRCANCHTISAEAGHRVGPNLFGILGRPVASLPDFDYSPALKSITGVWTTDTLDEFIKRPTHTAVGTDMSFRGIRNPNDREDLINWLATQGPDSQLPPPPDYITATLAQGDAARGWQLFKPCTACHSYVEGQPNRIGPNLYGIVGRRIASAPRFSYSERIIKRKGNWTPEKLNAFIFEAKTFNQGSHIAFRPLVELSDRADLIAWLRVISPDYAPVDEPVQVKGVE